jgi:crossover junction endodeoxyribonuclease RuvC
LHYILPRVKFLLAVLLAAPMVYTGVMRILGIDPGTGILGFGVIDVQGGNAQLVDAGVIRTPVKEDDAVRLQTIYEELTDIIAATSPTIMSVEKLFFARNVTTAMTVAQARGVVLLCGRQAGLDIFEYTPLQIKQSVTGYGKAEKKQVQEMVRILLKLKTAPKPDDCADALAAALTHAAVARMA